MNSPLQEVREKLAEVAQFAMQTREYRKVIVKLVKDVPEEQDVRRGRT
jgi:hypothetical protein